jgi:flagellar hook assembly protein FlgD
MITFNVDLTGMAGGEPSQPGRVGLSASPNPFGGTTTFYFAHPAAPSATIQVYSSSGELMRSIDMGRVPGLGFQVQWDGRDESGNLVPAGTYLYRVQGAGYTETQKVTLTR